MSRPSLIQRAYALASEIEWGHAQDRARLQRGPGYPWRSRKEATAAEYDPHAATELAELILRRMT
jgi:hypothetical protein